MSSNADVGARRGSGLGLAITYYGILGLVGAALAAWFVLSTFEAILGGYCDPGADFLCRYAEDLVAPAIAAVAGATLLPTAWRLRRDPPQLGPLVAVGVVVGIAVAVLPIVLILWAADFSGSFNIFGSEVPTAALVAIFVGPLLWALASAVAVWRQAERREV